MDDVALGRWQERVENSLKIITSLSEKNATHIEVINGEMGEVQIALIPMQADVATLKADMIWLKKFFWAIFGTATTAVILQVLDLLRMFPNQ